MARPTSLTPEVQEKIIAAIRGGNYRNVAAAAAGVHRNRFAEWERRGESGEEPYASFACALQKAEAEAEIALIAEVREGGEGWQSRAWVAERRWAPRWAARVRTQVAEQVEALTNKLRSDPELHGRVNGLLAEASPAAASDSPH